MGNVSLWQMLPTSVPEVDVSEAYSIPAAQTDGPSEIDVQMSTAQ